MDEAKIDDINRIATKALKDRTLIAFRYGRGGKELFLDFGDGYRLFIDTDTDLELSLEAPEGNG